MGMSVSVLGKEGKKILTLADVSQRIDDNSLGAFHFDDLSSAIWCAAMVDEPGNAASFCGINNSVLIDSKQITASDAALEVMPLPHVGNLLADLFTDVLNNHVVGCNIFHSVQTPVVDGRSSEFHRLLPLLELVEAERITFAIGRGKHLFLSCNISNKATVVDTIGP